MTTYKLELNSASGLRTYLANHSSDFLTSDSRGSNSGSTTLILGSEDNLVYSGGADDFILVTSSNPARVNGVLSGAGDDDIYGSVSQELVLAGAGADDVNGDGGDDRIFGEGGNDFLIGGSGDDRLSGGIGNDKLTGGAGNDILFGGKGRDTLIGGLGHNVLRGGNGDDLYFLAGNDRIVDTGGQDNYVIYAGTHITILDSGDSEEVDVISIHQRVENMTFTRQGNDLLVTGPKGSGEVDIEQFFKTGHQIDFLGAADGIHQMYELRDLADGENINGGTVWGWES